MTVSKGYIYSFLHCQMWRVNANGIPVGQLDPDNLTADTTSHAYKLDGIINAEFGTPEFGEVTFRSGTVFRGSVTTGLINPGQTTIATIGLDADLMSLLFGVNKDTTTIANTTASSFGFTKTSPYDIGVMFTAQIFSADTATLGESYYTNIIFPRCTARFDPMPFNQDGGENPSQGSLTLNLKTSDSDVLGIAFGANQGFEGNKEIAYFINSANPYALTTYIENGVATGYTTAYLPVSDEVTSGNTTNYFTQDGSVTAPTSISTSTGDVVITPGTSGDIANAFYQTQFSTA